MSDGNVRGKHLMADDDRLRGACSIYRGGLLLVLEALHEWEAGRKDWGASLKLLSAIRRRAEDALADGDRGFAAK